MKSLLRNTTISLAFLLSAFSTFSAVPKPITFEDVVQNKLPNFSHYFSTVYWEKSSEQNASSRYLQNNYCEAYDKNVLSYVETETGKVLSPLISPENWQNITNLASTSAIPALTNLDIATLSHSNFDANYNAFWISRGGDLYYSTIDGKKQYKLTNTPNDREELIQFSPDGNYLAFVSQNNLFVSDLQDGSTRQITTDGSENILNGKCSWVYYEEVYSRNWKGFWWSPDSAQIIYYRFDQTDVPIFTLINELGREQQIIKTRYPRAGESNPIVTLHTATVANGATTELEMPGYDKTTQLVTRVGFTPIATPWYIIQDRKQTWLDLYVNGEKRFHDHTEAWIEPPLNILFSKDGKQIILTSPRDGYCHIYHLNEEQTLTQLTTGDWEVRQLLGIDENTQWVYFLGMKDNPIGENLYRVNLKSKEIQKITTAPGTHQINISPDFKYAFDTWSSQQEPGNTHLYNISEQNGDAVSEPIRTIGNNLTSDIGQYAWGKIEHFQITLKDGYKMEAAWILPPNFDEKKQYPVWLNVYGGPEAPVVKDNWSGGRISDQSLAAEGVIVFYADPRSASAKGAKYAWECYKQFGTSEIADLTEAVEWLNSHSFVDPKRIGISGYSYGGSMTLWMLTHTKLFCAGIAGGSVTDWADYDSIYTERYMGTPENNPEGYKTSRITDFAKDLHGHLLIVHGSLDDNVHPCNTWKFVRELQKAGIQYQQIVYPHIGHAYGGEHHYRLMRNFIRQQLLP